jgi:hypothetical protein
MGSPCVFAEHALGLFEEDAPLKLFAMALFVVGSALVATAQQAVPEIDAQSGASAVTLLVGALLVMRSSLRK